MPGDLLVYPDSGGRQGHIGIVTVQDGQGPVLVIHCSSGNFTHTGDAIRETPPLVFSANARTRLVKIDFDGLRAIAGIDARPDDSIPFPLAGLRSLTLAHDASLKLVAYGTLVLEPTGGRMGGIGAVQEALRRLNRQSGTYGDRERANQAGEAGVFDDATAEALKSFQQRVHLEATGELDAMTLRLLDSALIGGLDPVLSEAAGPIRGDEGIEAVRDAAAPLPVAVRQDGSQYFARVGAQPEFFVGRRVTYQGRTGLMNSSRPGNVAYAATDHVGQWGHWAHLLEPTAMCEASAFFDRLNTYDSARFTFGFLQYAAHVAEGDFVQFLRRILALPPASQYFPDLSLAGGRVARVTNGQTSVLETAHSTELLQDYFNSSSQGVEDGEIINCAKLVHWCAIDPQHRAVQVEVGVMNFRGAMKTNHRRYNLEGRSDVTCLLIFDIHHQGRAPVSRVRAALANATTDESAWEELLGIGLPTYAGRIETLRRHTMSLVSAGVLGRRAYVASTNDFV
jgi:hypothetical protein